MAEGHFEQFRDAVTPFLELFASVRVACIAAAAKSGHFISLLTRISLQEEPVPNKAPLRVVEDIRPSDGFRALVVDYPYHVRADLIRQVLVDGLLELHIDSEIVQIYLTRDRARGAEFAFTWLPVRRYPRAQNLFGLDRPCITLEGYYEQTRDLLTNSPEEVKSRLHLLEPPIDGLDELFPRIAPGMAFNFSSTAPVQILAALPFDLAYDEARGLSLTAPSVAFDNGMRLALFFNPKGAAVLRLKTNDSKEFGESGMRQWQQPIDWGEGTEGAKAILSYREKEIDELSFRRRRAPDPRIAVDEYFDPQHKKLREFLQGASSKKLDNFEWGIQRLFSLFGIPFIWYGKGAVERRPDLAATIIKPISPPVVLLGECTQEKPVQKFSGLAERTRELREQLGDDVQILPVVFAVCGVVESEIAQAAERGIALLGREDLKSLLDHLDEGRVNAEELLFLLRERGSPPLKLGS